ncbi:uncharacterized protein LOC119770656 isoform X1 [Culex quinquefasciatus]|uniref:uncharacterized protein LOC119770656 isoform X1 n=1 Tax=Culex quinquefasciatus TaxID=7176 RepID=UPI0018E2A5C8|nr:uncharacterized protein LOC119770656 isoform X1 [Culex quinquefasciatus]
MHHICFISRVFMIRMFTSKVVENDFWRSSRLCPRPPIMEVPNPGSSWGYKCTCRKCFYKVASGRSLDDVTVVPAALWLVTLASQFRCGEKIITKPKTEADLGRTA